MRSAAIGEQGHLQPQSDRPELIEDAVLAMALVPLSEIQAINQRALARDVGQAEPSSALSEKHEADESQRSASNHRDGRTGWVEVRRTAHDRWPGRAPALTGHDIAEGEERKP